MRKNDEAHTNLIDAGQEVFDSIIYGNQPMKLIVVLAFLALFAIPHGSFGADSRPNVLFIAIDDLRDWAGYFLTNFTTQTSISGGYDCISK